MINISSDRAAKNFTASLPRGETIRVTVYQDAGVTDMDAEAEHVSECIAALKDAKYHFDRIIGVNNRIGCSFHLPRIEAQLDRERKERERISANAHRRAESYKAEAIGFACKSALGVPAGIHAHRLAAIEHEERTEQDEAERAAQRERERAIFRDAALRVEQRPERGKTKKVSDASLVAEVRTKRHSSISDVARAVGLAVPTTWQRLNALVKAGKLGADEVPRGAQGRPRGRGGAAGKAT